MKEKAIEGNTSPTIPETITTAQARLALGGISRTTEHRWQKRGILRPVYIVGRKFYRTGDIAALINGKGAAE
jgi:predicted site-specific integrase-resolvase